MVGSNFENSPEDSVKKSGLGSKPFTVKRGSGYKKSDQN
jgi:hypothetical protein